MDRSAYCKYYTTKVETLIEYCKCLYQVDGCLAGGWLHIWLDDGNCDESDIHFCLECCNEHHEDEGSDLGMIICKRYLELSENERRVFENMWNGREWFLGCRYHDNCTVCPMIAKEEKK